MAVYERATQAVETEERHQMFNIYIKRAAEIYGVTYTRAIYQKAIEVYGKSVDEYDNIMYLNFFLFNYLLVDPLLICMTFNPIFSYT